jgi:signal transduction histidine kinase
MKLFSQGLFKGSPTIRKQLLKGFFLLTGTLTLLTCSSLLYLHAVKQQAGVRDSNTKSHLLFLRQAVEQKDFFESEQPDSLSFVRFSDYFLEKQSVAYDKIMEELKQVGRSHTRKDDKYRLLVDTMLYQLIDHSAIAVDIMKKLEKKGGKGWGALGQLHHHGLYLRKDLVLSDLEKLTIDNYERAYLLGKENQYQVLMNQYLAQLADSLGALPKGLQTAEVLNTYMASFNQVVKLEREIGDFQYRGLKKRLASLTAALDRNFQEIMVGQQLVELRNLQYLNIFYLALVIFSLGLTILLSYYISTKFVKPLSLLTEGISRHSPDQPGTLNFATLPRTAQEFEEVARAFNELSAKIKQQMAEMEEKSEVLREKNQELIKVNHELDRFVYSASHDLKAPITSSLGLINIAKLENDPKQNALYLQMMERSLKKLNAFIEDILNVSRNARLDLQIEEVDFHQMIAGTFEQLNFEEKARAIVKKVEIYQKTPFYSDPKRMAIIFNNLISNAIRYSMPNLRTAYIMINIMVDAEKAYIRIKDNGCGIQKEHLPRIFNMFYRANDQISGSGLGLYIVKETIEKVDGTIQVQSVFESGTIFEMAIPNHFMGKDWKAQPMPQEQYAGVPSN